VVALICRIWSFLVKLNYTVDEGCVGAQRFHRVNFSSV
jgi:hypothetical protein